MNKTHPKLFTSQQAFISAGFTLVELLVGLLVSLFIIGATVAYMLTSAQSFKVQSNDSFSSENARFLLEYFSQNIRQAGLNASDDISTTVDLIYNGNRCSSAENVSTATGDTSACTVDDFSDGSDRIAIDFVLSSKVGAGGASTLCNNQVVNVPAGGSLKVANVYWTDDIDGDGVRSLYCQPLDVDNNTILGDGAPIIDGVDRIQVQYGVDSDLPLDGQTDGDGIIDAYHSYQNLVALNPAIPANVTRRVKAVRLAFLVSSGMSDVENANTEREVERTFNLLDAPEMKITDRIFRQVYSTTVMLPNAQ